MEIIRSAETMAEWSRKVRSEGKSIGLVPTMGALHEGHISLINRARQENDLLVISIFVNPLQFSPGEDYDRYPRDEEGDLTITAKAGADAVFAPDTAGFAEGEVTVVSVQGMNKLLCGESRPTHFDGVTTVVAKLFNVVAPSRAYFGEKDFQQLVIIKKMAADLRIPVEVVGCPIIRESDGLAMSSRNRYLEGDERSRALSLRRGILEAQRMAKEGIRETISIENSVKRGLNEANLTIDYVSICHPDTLDKIDHLEGPARILVAAKVGKTRLIDNDKLEV